MYVFISFISLMFQLAISLSNLKLDLTNVVAGALSGFIPFVGIVNVAITGLPIEISAIFLIFTLILSGIQTFILAMIVLSIVSNLIWSPNV